MKSSRDQALACKSKFNAVSTSNAPAAIGPYSQAIAIGDLLYVSGQLPLSLDGKDMPADIGDQARLSLQNIEGIGRSMGCTVKDAIKLTVYMTDLSGFAKVNEVMTSMLTAPYPARATVEVAGLPKSAQIEIEAILALPTQQE